MCVCVCVSGGDGKKKGRTEGQNNGFIEVHELGQVCLSGDLTGHKTKDWFKDEISICQTLSFACSSYRFLIYPHNTFFFNKLIHCCK